jgi:hypothetical protein
MKIPHMTIYSRESDVMRRYKAEFRRYPLTNRLVSSLSKGTDGVVCPRYYREN